MHLIKYILKFFQVNAIGFPEKTVALLNSHLSGRAFKVNINNLSPNLPKISCGVTQGSLSGFFLSLQYVNIMTQAVHSDLFDMQIILVQHSNTKMLIQLNINQIRLSDFYANRSEKTNSEWILMKERQNTYFAVLGKH